ncbi:MAG: PHP domain-containing protein, partial [Gemmatimonadetes bacterium]|nr:PHP domain-containing protein [Gemmatimonadota bacterium]NIU33999.1 PHP domain-containing protein [Gemmatimonadota bacterium]NIV64321.1 PHP domain-containing protein [Gemmatimonadota bacterium]NIW67064.1 PHP domain-containing protein [Gemmatimonadota bacterium]NIX42298.1 PHP domain-containing protein [Gemmatimonadota bacterium]
MKLDLHVHTTASDGSRSPTEVVHAALAARLDVIAITDHDTAAGVQEATEAALGQPIQIIPGIEVSSTHEGREIHVLGYFVDPSNPGLL